ncbi:hypothetical protein U1Q18_038636, partial [Sarracenia purpurea var. burkii]
DGILGSAEKPEEAAVTVVGFEGSSLNLEDESIKNSDLCEPGGVEPCLPDAR